MAGREGGRERLFISLWALIRDFSGGIPLQKKSGEVRRQEAEMKER